MAKADKEQIVLGKEPMVILPLGYWEEIEERLEDYDSLVRINDALTDPENKVKVPFEEIEKKYNSK